MAEHKENGFVGLARLLSTPDVVRVLNDRFCAPASLPNGPIKVEPTRRQNGTVGAAFDYLIRFYIERENKLRKTKWAMLNPGYYELQGDQKAAVETAERHYDTYISDGVFTDQLINSAIHLAQIDYAPQTRAFSRFGKIHHEDTEDLRRLVEIATKSKTFNGGTFSISDAYYPQSTILDGGIIKDDLVIYTNPTSGVRNFKRHYARSIMHCIMNASRKDISSIREVRTYFSRFDQLSIIKKDDFEATIPSIQDWFEKTFAAHLNI